MVPMGTKRVPFGDWLREEQTRAGWSLTEFAAMIGVEHSTLSRWVSGQRRPRPEQFEKIGRALELPTEVVAYHAGALPQLPRRLSEYERERELRRLTRQAEAGLARIQEVYIEEPEPAVRFYGRLPMEAERWMEAKGGTVVRAVPSDWIGTRSPDDFFLAQASGSCLAGIGILAGDYVLFEHAHGRTPAEGQLVAFRWGEHVSMQLWHRTGDWVELRDSDGTVVRRFSIFDDFTIEGLWAGKRRSP